LLSFNRPPFKYSCTSFGVITFVERSGSAENDGSGRKFLSLEDGGGDGDSKEDDEEDDELEEDDEEDDELEEYDERDGEGDAEGGRDEEDDGSIEDDDGFGGFSKNGEPDSPWRFEGEALPREANKTPSLPSKPTKAAELWL
jgi:hypothetical protein